MFTMNRGLKSGERDNKKRRNMLKRKTKSMKRKRKNFKAPFMLITSNSMRNTNFKCKRVLLRLQRG